MSLIELKNLTLGYDKDIILKDIENFYNQSSVLYDFCINKYRVHDIVASPILNSLNEIVGLLTLEYQENNPLDFEDLDLADIETETKIIGELLELNKKEKNNTEKK